MLFPISINLTEVLERFGQLSVSIVRSATEQELRDQGEVRLVIVDARGQPIMDSSQTALHRYRRGQGSNPGKPDFFRLSFRNCISCVNNCEDLLYTYFFIPQFKYMSFIYS